MDRGGARGLLSCTSGASTTGDAAVDAGGVVDTTIDTTIDTTTVVETAWQSTQARCSIEHRDRRRVNDLGGNGHGVPRCVPE